MRFNDSIARIVLYQVTGYIADARWRNISFHYLRNSLLRAQLAILNLFLFDCCWLAKNILGTARFSEYN